MVGSSINHTPHAHVEPLTLVSEWKLSYGKVSYGKVTITIKQSGTQVGRQLFPFFLKYRNIDMLRAEGTKIGTFSHVY